jgi:hypothetical protein
MHDMQRAEAGRQLYDPPRAACQRDFGQAGIIAKGLASSGSSVRSLYFRVDDAIVHVWKRSPRNDL